jgi:hypothetical protein
VLYGIAKVDPVFPELFSIEDWLTRPSRALRNFTSYKKLIQFTETVCFIHMGAYHGHSKAIRHRLVKKDVRRSTVRYKMYSPLG